MHLGDHRKHDAQFLSGTCLEQRPELQAQQGRPVERHADGAPAHRRIVFFDLAQIGEQLVRPDIERAEGHRPLVGGGEDAAIVSHLRIEARKMLRHHELQFGAEQADAVGP